MTSPRFRALSHWTLVAGLSALPAVLGSCGAKEDDKLANADSFCEEWGKRACNETVVGDCGAPDVDACIDAQKAFCLKLVDENAYSKAGAKECLDAVEKAYLDSRLDGAEMATVLNLGAPCDAVMSGDTPGGGGCTQNNDCDIEGGFTCVMRLQESGEPKGQCHVPTLGGGGERCTSPDVQCADGFYCNGSNCISNSEAGEQCSNTTPCASGLKCVIADGETEGTCENRAADGSSCLTPDDCASGVCSPSANDESICTKYVVLDVPKDICDNFRP